MYVSSLLYLHSFYAASLRAMLLGVMDDMMLIMLL